MKQLAVVTSVCLLGLLTLVPAADAQTPADCPKAVEQMQSFLERKCAIDKTKPSVALAFDHTTQQWRAYHLRWKKQDVAPCSLFPVKEEVAKPDFELHNNNIPRLALGSEDKVAIMVVDTDPLVYGVVRKPATESDIESLAQVRTFVAAISGFSQAYVSAKSVADRAWAGTASQASANLARYTSPPGFRPGAVPKPLFGGFESSDFKKAVQELEKVRADYHNAFDRLDRDTTALAKDLADLENAVGTHFAFLNLLEADAGTAKTLLPRAGSVPTVKQVNDAFSAMASSKMALLQAAKPCAAPCPKLQTAVELIVKSAGHILTQEERKPLVSALGELRDLLRSPSLDCEATQLSAIETILGVMEAFQGQDLTFTKNGLDQLVELQPFSATSPKLVEMSAKALIETDKLLAKRLDQTGVVAALSYAMDRVTVNLAPNDPELCSLRHGVIQVPEPAIQLKWSKVYTGKFQIKAAGWNADTVVKRHDEIAEVTYELVAKHSFDFTLGFGLIYTTAMNPSWSAVKDPANANQSVIAKTSEEPFAGSPTMLFTTYPHCWSQSYLRPGLDIGVGLSTSKPAAYLGLSVRVAPFARIGVGEGWFLVDSLAHGQTTLTVVSSKDDIRTQKTVTGRPYVSLVITLDELDFFKPK